MTWGAVLAASLFGSLHCAGMCGGFVAATQPEGKLGRATIGYQGARLLVYLLLGLVAGAAGAGVDALGSSLGLERAAAVLMGLSLMGAGLASFYRLRKRASGELVAAAALSPRRAGGEKPGIIARARRSLAMHAAPGSLLGGAALGTASAFLPCGWLWSFVLVAGATGGAVSGAFVMSALWLGSLPALLAAGFLATTLVRVAGRHAPWIGAALIVGLGAWNLIDRWPDASAAESAATTAPCHAQPGEAK
jgi:sulfite exporter TauE/SafE